MRDDRNLRHAETRTFQPPSIQSRAVNNKNYNTHRLSHYGPAATAATHVKTHPPRNMDRQGPYATNAPRPMGNNNLPGTGSRRERQRSFTQFSKPVVSRSESFRSQGSFNRNAESPRDARPNLFRREGSHTKESSRDNSSMRRPSVQKEGPMTPRDQFSPSMPLFRNDSPLDRFVSSSSNRGSDTSPNNDIFRRSSDSDRPRCPLSSSCRDEATPREDRYRGDGTPRDEKRTRDDRSWVQGLVPANLRSIPPVPSLDHRERPIMIERQEALKNRWVPPTKAPPAAEMPKVDHKVLSEEEERKQTASFIEKRESPMTDEAKTLIECREELSDTYIPRKEEITSPICDLRPLIPMVHVPYQRLIHTAANKGGSNLKTIDNPIIPHCTSWRELPIPELTDSSLDSRTERHQTYRQLLPSAPVVSESPHSSSNSIVDARYETITKGIKPAEHVKIDHPNTFQGATPIESTLFSTSEDNSSDDESSESDTDEEEVMRWGQKMFGISQGQSQVPQEMSESSDESSDDEPFVPPPVHAMTASRNKPDKQPKSKLKKFIQTPNAMESEFETTKKNPPLARKKRVQETEEEHLKRVAEAKIKKEQAKPPTAAELVAILGNDDFIAPSTNWVRRSVRQPNHSALTSTNVRNLIDKLKNNESDMVVLKMKKYINDPDTPSVVIDAALDALGDNSNCQALYIQNFNKGMRDEQLLRLLEVLMLPTCKIFCLNIGETYNVKSKTWKQFAIGLKKTKVTHMYASEHTISGELKDRIRETIRNNRKKHDMHCNPNNLDVIVQCTHCWWNPMNAKSLRPYLKNKGYEQLLLDTEAQGLRGSTSGAALN
jgi:hypothetical protein